MVSGNGASLSFLSTFLSGRSTGASPQSPKILPWDAFVTYWQQLGLQNAERTDPVTLCGLSKWTEVPTSRPSWLPGPWVPLGNVLRNQVRKLPPDISDDNCLNRPPSS